MIFASTVKSPSGSGLAEEGDRARLGLVDRARAQREHEAAVLGPRGARAGRRRRRMPEAPALGIERRRRTSPTRVRHVPGAVDRTAGLRAAVDAEPVERRRCRRRCSRGRRRGRRAAAPVSGAAWPAWPISVQVCAVVGRELADDLRAVVAGAQQHVVGQLAARRRRDALRDRRVDRAVLGDDVLELVVAAARLDGDDLAEGVRALGLPDHEARLLAVGVDRARVEPRRHGPLAARRVLQQRVGRERVVGDEVALEDRQAQAAARDRRAAAGRAQHASTWSRAPCRRTRRTAAGRSCRRRSGSIVKVTDSGGSSTLPARSRERNSTVWAPSPRTVNVVTNGSAVAGVRRCASRRRRRCGTRSTRRRCRRCRRSRSA